MKEKVLLIRPPFSSELNLGSDRKSGYGGHEIELGLLYLASYIESKGIDVSFLDMSLYSDAEDHLLSVLNEGRFAFVGITAYTSFITIADRIAGVVKRHSGAKTIIGGAHASALPEETLERFKNFDCLVYGEGEIPLLEIVTGKSIADIKGAVWRDGDRVVKNPPSDFADDLDGLPFPARHLTDLSRYIPPTGNYYRLPSTGILSARGCPFKCTYCSRAGTRFRNKMKYRSIGSVIDEIEHCIERYGIRDFRFYDDTFVLSKKRVMEFCAGLRARKIKITWNCYSRVDTIDAEMLIEMKKAGCYHIKYGIEFGTEKWLRETKKNTTLDQARRAISATKKVGIAAKASFMMGMPGETVGQIRQTIRFARELNPTYTTFDILSPLPGSEIFEEAKREADILTYDYDAYIIGGRKILKSQLDPEVLNGLLREAYRKVYFNPRFIWHRLIHLLRNPSLAQITGLFSGLRSLLFVFERRK